jgi:hypothetical protein
MKELLIVHAYLNHVLYVICCEQLVSLNQLQIRANMEDASPKPSVLIFGREIFLYLEFKAYWVVV